MKLNKEQMMEVLSNANRLADHALLSYWSETGEKETSYHQITVIKMLKDLRHLIDFVELETMYGEEV